jgi:predicted nucleic acid-binding protein
VSPVFLDTGYLIALESVNDQHHSAAIAHWRQFLSNPARLVTTSFVLDEVVTFFANRGRHAKAVELGRQVMSSAWIELVHVDESLLRTGFEFLERRPDKRFSLTDCVSFVLMKQRGITDALTFDGHFEQAGFGRLPHPPR